MMPMHIRETLMHCVVVPLCTPRNNHWLYTVAFGGLTLMAWTKNRPTRVCMVGGLMGLGILVRRQTIAIVSDEMRLATLDAVQYLATSSLTIQRLDSSVLVQPMQEHQLPTSPSAN